MELKIKDLYKSYDHGKTYAINDVSADFTPGIYGILGPNGAGKSTSLGLVAGVIKPTKGTVTTQGRVASMLELGGGFHPELTGRENIYLNATLLGLRRKEVQQRMDRIIEFSELGDFIDEPIRVYSSGMLAKLGFSVIRENYRPERKDWKLDLRVNELTELEIFAEENPPKRLNRPEACGLRHLAFCVDSVEQTVNELAEVGIECEPIRMDDYTGKKMTFFHDPDGLPLELHE